MKLRNSLNFKTLFSIIFALSAVFILYTLFRNNTRTTFSMVDKNEIIQKDLTGDGKKDILYIKRNKDKYYLQVNTKDKTYQLDPSKNLNTLGTHYDFWPMNVTLKDINRDNVPEIIIQGNEKEAPISHIFSFDKGNFENIFSSKNNILGFIDTKSNQTPKFLCGNYYNEEIFLKNYMLVNGKLLEFNYNTPKNFLGSELIRDIITLFIKEDDDDNIKERVVSNINESLITPIFKEKNSGYKFKFQDAYFEDVECDKDGNLLNLKWILNFKGTMEGKDTQITFQVNLRREKDSNDKEHKYKAYYFQKKI